MIRGAFFILNHFQIGKGKDIIFLHGWGGSTASFYGVAKRLSRNYRCTLLDFYGFGKSKHPQRPLNLQDYANAVENIIKNYKMEDVILVSHSFGGRVAILLSSYCNRIAGICLCDSAGIKPRRSLKYYYKIYKYKICKKLGIRNIKSGSVDYNKLQGVMKETFVRVVNQDLTPILKKVVVPTLIVWGDKDKDTPLYMAKKLHRHILGSSLNILEEAGHYSYIDNFNQFMGILSDFLKKFK